MLNRSRSISTIALSLVLPLAACSFQQNSSGFHPSAPSVSRVYPSASPGYDGKPTIHFDGLPFFGGKINIYADGVCSDSALALYGTIPFGAIWLEVTLGIANAGSYTFSAKVQDDKGNWSNCSTTNAQYTLLVPPTPTALSLSNPTTSPGFVATPAIQVSGTSSGVTTKLFSNSTCTAPSVGSQASFSTNTSVTTSSLPYGTYTFYAQLTGNTGLNSACSSANVTYTYSTPPVPNSLTLITPATSPGFTPTPTIRIGGIGSGVTANLYTDSTCTTKVASASAFGSTVDMFSGFWNTPLAFGAFTLYSNTNVGASVSACSTANVAYTRSLPPVPSSLTLITPSASPGYISQPTIRVGGIGDSMTVNLYTDSTCTTKVASKSAFSSSEDMYGSTWSTSLAFGSYTLYANTNSGTTYSACSTANAAYTYALPPVPSSLVLVSPATSPGTTSKPTIRVDGIGNGVTVNLYTDSSCTTKVASKTASGTPEDVASFSWTGALSFGASTLYANTNLGTTFSACSTANVGYTLNPLTSPSSITLVTPASSPSYYQTPLVSVAGVASGQTVKLYSDSTCATEVGSASAFGTSVNIQVSTLLPSGANTFYAKVFDNNYGQSLCSTANLAYTVTPRSPFGTYTRYSTGSSPQKIVAGDFNTDTKLDLVSANNQNGAAGLFQGNGDGTFQADRQIVNGNYTSAVASADFNGDGRLDVAFGDYASNRFFVQFGNGDGTFQPTVSYTVGSGWVQDIASVDLNGDGKPDLVVVVSFSTGGVYCLLNNGNGTFLPPVFYPTPNGATYLAVADVNKDGKPDVVVSTYSAINVMLGNGDGTLQANVSYPLTANSVNNFAVADINGDTFPDIVVAGGSTGFITLLNNGGGGFGAPAITSVANVIYQSISLADMDRDGKVDVVAGDWSNNRIAIHYGLGDGTFDLPEKFATDSRPEYTLVLDLDGNLNPDIVVCTSYSSGGLSSGSLSILKR